MKDLYIRRKRSSKLFIFIALLSAFSLVVYIRYYIQNNSLLASWSLLTNPLQMAYEEAGESADSSASHVNATSVPQATAPILESTTLDPTTKRYRSTANTIKKLLKADASYPELQPGAHNLFPFLRYSEDKTWTTLPKYVKNTIGIVMCVGMKQLRFASHSIKALRDLHGSNIPVQIVYAGKRDLTVKALDHLTSLGVDITSQDLLEVFDSKNVDMVKYALKPFALLQSPFQHTILVDADIVWTSNPEVMLKEEGYIRTGTFFFHDRRITEKNWKFDDRHQWIQDLMSSPHIRSQYLDDRSDFFKNISAEEQDSGVVIINKDQAGVKAAVLFICWLHMKGNKELLYGKTWGDKESYWIAFELLNVEYHFETQYAGIIGWPKVESDQTTQVCGNTMLHRSSNGQNLWYNGSLLKNYHLKDLRRRDYLVATHLMTEGVWIRKHDMAKNLDDHCMMDGNMETSTSNEVTLLTQMVKLAQAMDKEIIRKGLRKWKL